MKLILVLVLVWLLIGVGLQIKSNMEGHGWSAFGVLGGPLG